MLPLVTLPYLARVLGPHDLGLVVFSQSFTWMLQLVIEFGFGQSAMPALGGVNLLRSRRAPCASRTGTNLDAPTRRACSASSRTS